MTHIVNPDEKSWTVELTGCETIANRRMERVGDNDVKVYGTAHIHYALAATVILKRVQGKWRFGSGRIARATIRHHDASYTPSNIYKIKRIYCANVASISRMAGRAIAGVLIDEKLLKLTWPRPQDFREPAVVVVIDAGGGIEKEACFSSDRFLDYASAFHLQLKPGIQPFDHGFKGALDKAHAAYQFSLRAMT